jgi:hypothetical protein
MARMTEEEADALDELWTKTTPPWFAKNWPLSFEIITLPLLSSLSKRCRSPLRRLVLNHGEKNVLRKSDA